MTTSATFTILRIGGFAAKYSSMASNNRDKIVVIRLTHVGNPERFIAVGTIAVGYGHITSRQMRIEVFHVSTAC